MKYLVWWKRFTVEYKTKKRVKDLENTKKVEFEGRMSAEVRRQEKLDRIEERDFRREKLPGKYTVRILYRWNNGKFEEEYLRKLERN